MTFRASVGFPTGASAAFRGHPASRPGLPGQREHSRVKATQAHPVRPPVELTRKLQQGLKAREHPMETSSSQKG